MVRKSVAEILEKHVTFELECVDLMYLNAYVPSLQRASGFVWFLRSQLGCRVLSTAMVNHWSDRRGSRITHFHALAHMPLPCGPEFVDQIADTSVLNGGRRPPDQLRGLTGPFRTTTFVVIASRTTRPPGSSATGSWTIAASASPYASSNLSRSMPSCRRIRASRPAPMSLAL
jgi:hypothetical protein